ncbi:MAG: DMT family transporter [Bacillota bacterium]|nr:DMT family transporter [Bacillota bacterium]
MAVEHTAFFLADRGRLITGRHDKSMKKAYAYVILTALLFGTMEVACKIGGSKLDPLQLTFLRFLIGGLILLPFAVIQLKQRQIRLRRRDLSALAGIGFLGVTVSMSLFQFSIMMCNASTVSVIICINPFFTMIFAHFLTGEKMNRQKLLILAVAMAGIIFMIRPWDIQEGNSAIGIGLMVAAAVVFGLYTVAGKVSQEKLGLMAQTSISFIFGAVFLLAILLVSGRPVVSGIAANIPIILYAGIMVTGLGYYCYFRAIGLAGASVGSFAFFLKPAIAPLMAVIVLRERVLWNTIAGIVLVLTASLLNILYQRKIADQQRSEIHRLEANR